MRKEGSQLKGEFPLKTQTARGESSRMFLMLSFEVNLTGRGGTSHNGEWTPAPVSYWVVFTASKEIERATSQGDVMRILTSEKAK